MDGVDLILKRCDTLKSPSYSFLRCLQRKISRSFNDISGRRYWFNPASLENWHVLDLLANFWAIDFQCLHTACVLIETRFLGIFSAEFSLYQIGPQSELCRAVLGVIPCELRMWLLYPKQSVSLTDTTHPGYDIRCSSFKCKPCYTNSWYRVEIDADHTNHLYQHPRVCTELSPHKDRKYYILPWNLTPPVHSSPMIMHNIVGIYFSLPFA